jgi:hypothetical protein
VFLTAANSPFCRENHHEVISTFLINHQCLDNSDSSLEPWRFWAIRRRLHSGSDRGSSRDGRDVRDCSCSRVNWGGGPVLHNGETLGRINVQGGHGCGSFASCQMEGVRRQSFIGILTSNRTQMCKQGASELEKDKSPSRVLQRRSRGIKLERGAGRTIKLLDEFGSHQAVG